VHFQAYLGSIFVLKHPLELKLKHGLTLAIREKSHESLVIKKYLQPEFILELGAIFCFKILEFLGILSFLFSGFSGFQTNTILSFLVMVHKLYAYSLLKDGIRELEILCFYCNVCK